MCAVGYPKSTETIARSEKMSSDSRDGHDALATVIEFLHPGDELMVTRLGRLGRDCRSGHRLTDRFRILCIVLLPLHLRFDARRRH